MLEEIIQIHHKKAVLKKMERILQWYRIQIREGI